MKSLVSVLGAFVLGATASAQSFTFDLNGMQEGPPVPTSGTGTATVKVDVTTGAVLEGHAKNSCMLLDCSGVPGQTRTIAMNRFEHVNGMNLQPRSGGDRAAERKRRARQF